MKNKIIFIIMFCICTSFVSADINLINDISPEEDETISENNIEIKADFTSSEISSVNFNWEGDDYNYYDNSLILMMNFDNNNEIGETTTFIKDLSIYQNNGVVTGATWISSDHNGAYEFKNELSPSLPTDYINIPHKDILNIDSTFTIMTWVKSYTLSSSLTWQAIISKHSLNRPASLWFHFNKVEIWFNPSGMALASTRELQDDTWYHLTETFDGTTLSLYIDGILDASKTTAVPYLNNMDLYLGQRGDGQFGLNGAIDEVRIYNRALNADEIKQQYESNLRKYQSDKWELNVKKQGLSEKTYNYDISYIDSSSNQYSTGTTTFKIGEITPNYIKKETKRWIKGNRKFSKILGKMKKYNNR